MRKTRNAVIATALGLGMAVGVGSTAYAQTGAQDNVSSIEAGISPNAQSATEAGPATLFSQVQTLDADGTTSVPAGGGPGPLAVVSKAAEKVVIDFDDDMNIDTSNFPQCGGQGGANLDGDSTVVAITECGNAVIGSGQAAALIPQLGKTELTITTINGPTTVAGGACTTPGDAVGGPEGCEFQGGKPQVILHAFAPALNNTTTTVGEIQDSTDTTADYGQRLFVSDAPDVAGDAGSLTLFNSTVGSNRTETASTEDTEKGKTKTKRKKKGNKTTITKTRVDTTTVTNTESLVPLVTATCTDDGGANGGLEYDFKVVFTYDDNTTSTDTYKQKCGNPAP